jgi:hypothetical protein
MIRPDLVAWVEQGKFDLSFGVNSSYEIVASLIAATTGKRKIIRAIITPQRLRLEMI